MPNTANTSRFPKSIFKLFRDLALPLILIAEIILCLCFGDLISLEVKSALYAVSLTIKEGLLMVLPFLIFSFLMASIGTLEKGAISFIVIAFGLVVLSNFVATSTAGFLGMITLKAMGTIQPFQENTQTLKPLWDLDVPSFISNDVALVFGIVSGFIISFLGRPDLQKTAQKLQNMGLLFLRKVFIPLIPLFVLGFILKMDYDGILDIIVKDYLSVFVAITCLAYGYMIILYGMSCGFNLREWRERVQVMLPAVMTGFSTMSSASAMPLITAAAERKTKNSVVTGVVPLSINIHMIGDCFSLSILALAILSSFGMPMPSAQEFLIFTGFFVLARFSVAAVPGGGVIVILPVLEAYLGFSPEMLSLILALYILFDPIATSANVFGNGAFAFIFEKIHSKWQGR